MRHTATAVTTVATRASKKALRRARRASRNWLMSMFSPLEEGFSYVDDVVRSDALLQADVGLDQLAVGRRAAQLEPPVAAPRGDAAAGRDRLHDAHVLLDAVGARARHLTVDVEHRRTVDVDRLAAFEREALAEQGHLLLLAVARDQHLL